MSASDKDSKSQKDHTQDVSTENLESSPAVQSVSENASSSNEAKSVAEAQQARSSEDVKMEQESMADDPAEKAQEVSENSNSKQSSTSKSSHTPTTIPEPLPKDDTNNATITTASAVPPPPPKDKTNESSAYIEQDEEKAAEAERERLEEANAETVSEPTAEDRQDGNSKPEIRGIMTQFESIKDQKSNETQVQTPSNLPVFQYPPRISSLVNTSDSPEGALETPSDPKNDPFKPPTLSRSSSVVSAPPLPEPEPEPDLPFDFHRFLEQLRHRTADPVAKFLRSFLQEFSKRQWMVHEQQKIISDFLTFITNRMAQCEVWASVSDAEFDNAREGMEKLVMNRLHSQTFSPEIPPAEASGRRRKVGAAPLGPGRRGQHQEDVERDEILAQKVRIYGWVKEEHLDLQPFNDKSRRFMSLAEKELAKIKDYRAPRDKIICILNCCKVLFGVLKSNQADQSADSFIPLLIYTVLKANPEHLVSNVQYILRFRNPDKLSGEAGYYMSSLLGAVQFIENLDKTNLTISDEEFEKNVELAVSAIAEREKEDVVRQQAAEKPLPSRPSLAPKPSAEGTSTPRRTISNEDSEENAAVSGLLRTIQKPLTTIGRMFSDEAQPTQSLPTKTSSRPIQPVPPPPPPNQAPGATALSQQQQQRQTAELSAAKQASSESAEAHRVARQEHVTIVETLAGMFPGLDREIISDVVRQKEGRVGQAVDACLALTRP